MTDIVAITFLITGNCDEVLINQIKNMIAAMSVRGQRVQFFYSSLDTTIFSAHITCAIITLGAHMFQIKPKLRKLGENRRCKIFACC